MNILKSFFSVVSPEPAQVEITPTVKPALEKSAAPAATTLEDAQRRHGRAFRAQSCVGRITPPSDDLEKLNRLSAAAEPRTIVVTDISSRRKP